MRRRATPPLLALLALVACQDPDVGNPCPLTWSPTGTPSAPSPVSLYESGGSDYFEAGNTACDDLVCIVSPAPESSRYGCTIPGCGYCSKPCVSNQDCFESETGLICRQMILDPVFLEQLDPVTRDRYLSEVQFSSYCAVPR